MKTSQQLARETDPMHVRARAAIRRVIVNLTSGALWQITGFRLIDGTETRKAEAFTGIGIAARPPSSNATEAIVVMVGDANSPTIIAVRDEKTRKAIAGALGLDETMLFNSAALVHVKADGTIEARTPGGDVEPLVKRSEFNALIAAYNAHTHTGSSATGGAVTTIATTSSGTNATGTTVLKAE